MKNHSLIRKLNITTAGAVVMVLAVGSICSVFAVPNVNFTLAVNPGTLAVDFVDGSYATIASPVIPLGAVSTKFVCQSTGGTLGTASQLLYIQNPDAADNGWAVSIAAASPTDFWSGTGGSMDFNDPETAGCTDGADTDSLKGQMAVDASSGTLAAGACSSCDTTAITKGASSAFDQLTVDSITLLTAAAGSSDYGDWKLTGVPVTQTIPAEQVATSDYVLNMILSVVSS